MLEIKKLSVGLDKVLPFGEGFRVLYVPHSVSRSALVHFIGLESEVAVSSDAGKGFLIGFDKWVWEGFLMVYPLARGLDVFVSLVAIELDALLAVKVEARILQLLDEVSKGANQDQQKLMLGMVLIEMLSHLIEAPVAVDLPGRLKLEFLELLEENFRKERATRFYARRLAVSSRRLNEYCRGWFEGKNVFDMVMDRLCSEAEYMLLSSDVPVKAVAYDLGFSSTQHFRVYLKRYRGVTPSGVRENGLDGR